MPVTFKNNFSPELVAGLATMLTKADPEFRAQPFLDFVLQNFDSLELKQRSARITEALHLHMPGDLLQCKKIIEAILHPQDIEELATTQSDDRGLRGWVIMPLADFVSSKWIKVDFIEGLRLLKTLTRRFSAEFAIRDFILFDQTKALKEIALWLDHPNEHIRRLASEGTRPRLPWGKQLPALITDPAPLMVILETLLNDGSEYVRRSVANNLNDIAKDHPDFVVDFCTRHKDLENNDRKRLLKHACRSLFKNGDERILALFGFEAFVGDVSIKTVSKQVGWGGELYFEVEVTTTSTQPQNLMLDYVIWHQKANGKQSAKVFKWKVIDAFKGVGAYKKIHSFKPVTTRKYYPGAHKIGLQINGKLFCEQAFELLKNDQA